MKILHLLVSGGTGGIEVLMQNYSQYSSHENSFAFLWGGGRIADGLRDRGIPVLELDVNTNGSRRTLESLAALAKREGYDVVISHNSAPLLKIALLWLKFRFPKIHTIAYAHADVRDICGEKPGLWLRRLVHRLGFSKADGVIAVSRSVKQSLVDELRIPEEKICVIYNGTPVPDTMPERMPSQKPKLIYVGRLVPEKGVQRIMEALSRLRGELDFSFEIVGDGPYRQELEGLARRLQLEDKVRFLGWRQDIPLLLAQADFFVHFPVWEEGFGITVIEAMAAGCICVCTPSGALKEIIRDGENGYIVQSDPPEELPGALKRAILDEKSEQVRLSAFARAGDFSIDKFTAALDTRISAVGRAAS